MSDFFQNGQIVTLHRLTDRSLEELESELIENARKRQLALVLPSLYSELETPALPNIIEELKEVRYVNEIVVTMFRMTAPQFKRAKEFFSVLPQHWRVIWNDGPRMKKLYNHLEKIGIDVGVQGKGSQTWMANGYIIATGASDVIALHDCDIRNYTRELLARFAGHEVPDKTIFIEQGKPGNGLYLLLQGNAEVLTWNGEEYIQVAKLGPGDIAGEISLIHEAPATATVRTLGKTTLLFLARELFKPLVDAVPDLLKHFAKMANQRLADTELKLKADRIARDTGHVAIDDGGDENVLSDDDIVLL